MKRFEFLPIFLLLTSLCMATPRPGRPAPINGSCGRANATSLSNASNVTIGSSLSTLGAGSLTFTGTNVFTGSTTVSGGTLLLSDPSNPLYSGGTLTAAGCIIGGYDCSGASLTLTTIGTIWSTGGTLVLSGSSFVQDSGATLTAAVNTSGSVVLNGSQTSTTVNGDIVLNSQSFNTINTAGFGANSFNTGSPGNGLATAAVPEPGSFAMLVGGFGMLLLLRRIRTAKGKPISH